jgi:hypothetical protein
MKAADPKKTKADEPEKNEFDQENYPENGNETLTESETDSSDLETEPLDDEDNDL